VFHRVIAMGIIRAAIVVEGSGASGEMRHGEGRLRFEECRSTRGPYRGKSWES
jgi:hypothetical protein